VKRPGSGPIGVFDSGLGGLTVLKALCQQLPGEDFLYFADQAHCPYGGQSVAAVQARAVAITDALLEADVKLIVVACNTATIAAISMLRARYRLPFVGMEPAVKPARALTRSGVIGVLATPGSLSGDKFQQLVATHAQGVEVLRQPCPGWVEAVEAGALETAATRERVAAALTPVLARGADVLVLGCTHFPLLRPLIEAAAGPKVTLLDTGPAVARQTERILNEAGLRNPRTAEGRIQWLGTGDDRRLREMRQRLGLEAAADGEATSGA
jgi:glutamate racemase